MNTGRYNLRSLLLSSEIEQIIIPEIQRDYVWNESNVMGLMNSILDHFKKKETLDIEIIDHNNADINQDIQAFLSEEYTRMVHSTRIGFIYAYHSQDYPGKFFLIDGQQRLTTIFLLHLCAYKHAQMNNDYRKLFFKDKQPKIDYKVREISHDFLVDFIDHETTSTGIPFIKSVNYYNFYNEDVTTKSMIQNYEYIERMLEKCLSELELKRAFYNELVNYIENYIEFNYFDTNISEQGERLYLYMNSRGEALSTQESLRPILISRCEHKLEAGEKWEEWQNFFWRKRGNNPNADIGFQEFLRWATFLHLCLSTDPKLYNKKNNNETKQDYIRIEKRDDIKQEQQKRWIKDYQKDNQAFSIDFIDKIYKAVCKLDEYLKKENWNFIVDHWLSFIDTTNDYPTIFACVSYLYYYPEATELDIKRIGMFTKNCMYYDTNRKNPEMASVNIVNTIRHMYENQISDIIYLYKIAAKLSKNIFTEADKHKTACQLTMFRTQWENLFWTITDDDVFSSFLEGNTSCLFEWSEYDTESFEKYYKCFKKKIVNVIKQPNNKDEKNKLHEELLSYGDFAVKEGYGNGIPRYYMLLDENEWAWGVNEHKPIRDILKKYLSDEKPSCDGELYQLLIDKNATNQKSVLPYMEYMELLKSDGKPTHIILPRKYQISGDNYRELMTQWVHQEMEGSWVYQTNVVVKEFDIQEIDKTCKIIDCKNNSAFYLDIIYNWDDRQPNWSFKIGTRGKEYHNNIPSIIKNWNITQCQWEERFNNEKQHNMYYLNGALDDDVNSTIHDRTQAVITFVNRIWDILKIQK